MDISPLLLLHPAMFLGILAVLASLTYWLGYCWREGVGAWRSFVKTLAVAALALLGGMLDAPWLVTAGLAFGALGDFALSRPGQRALLAGMAAFALGHLAYTFWFLGAVAAPDAMRLAAMLGLVLLMLSTRVWLLPATGALAPAVAAYVGVIALMGLLALASTNRLALLGAGLFILSDLLLAIALFRPVGLDARRAISLTLWPAYWGGQALILLEALGSLPFHPAP
jgi:uncharacterized membrane protein YhhN